MRPPCLTSVRDRSVEALCLMYVVHAELPNRLVLLISAVLSLALHSLCSSRSSITSDTVKTQAIVL